VPKKCYPLIHDDAIPIQLERAAYTGGDCRVFYIGEYVGQVTNLDVSSLYPYVMARNKYPCKLRGHECDVSIARLKDIAPKFGMVARVLLSTDNYTYPVKRHGLVIHATGRFWTTLAGPELLQAIYGGHVVECSEFAWYDMADLFSEYVGYLYGLKEQYEREGNAVMRSLSKNMLNALSGKWGQRGHKWVDRPGMAAPIQWGQWIYADLGADTTAIRRVVGGHVQESQPDSTCPTAMVAIAAYVTSYARVFMTRLRHAAGTSEVLYQDTDSVHVTEDGHAALRRTGWLCHSGVGSLRIVGVADCAHYYGLRNYRFGEQWVVAGLPAKSEQIGLHTWRQENWQRLPDIISARPKLQVSVCTTESSFTQPYRHGVVAADGTVSPIRLQE
jgi:hypothetical protein